MRAVLQKMSFLEFLMYVFFCIAFFNPFPLYSNVYPVDIFALFFFIRKISKHNLIWFILIFLFFILRSLSQFFFFKYVSPDIITDSFYFLIYIGSCFAFNALFKEKNGLNYFISACGIMGWMLVFAIIVSAFLPNSMLSYFEGGKRLSWEPFNEGGPRFSAVFAFIGLLHLYAFNMHFPNAKFVKKVIEVIKIIPFFILCVMGGTRVFLFAFLLGIILHFRISLMWTIITVGLFSLLPLESVFSSLSRNSADGARGIIWANFYLAIMESNSTFWWGYGPGGINLQIVGAGEDAFFRLTHNLFLQIWFEFGLPIMIIAILYYLRISFQVFRFKQTNPIIYAIFAFVILAELFDGTFSFIGCQWVFTASYALIFLEIREMHKKYNIPFQAEKIEPKLVTSLNF